MIESPILETNLFQATSGEIAVINLESALQQSWSRFWQSPQRPGIAEQIVEQEQMSLQFLSDFGALDRLHLLMDPPVRTEAKSWRDHASCKRRSHPALRIDLPKRKVV